MANLAGTDASEVLTGTGSADVIEGMAGDDTISGLGGADRLYGGTGADWLYGGAGADTLDGGSGADRLAGGSGDDSYYVDSAGDTVVEVAGGSAGGADIVYSAVDFTLGDNLENLRLYKGASLGTGNGLDNRLTGNAADNVLSGLGGADTLSGGDGADKLYGGKGEDRLLGGAGADTLDGGAGADWMEGGAGDDSYYVNMSGDVVAETKSGAAGGIDIVYSAVAFALGENLENLRLYKDAASGTGNGLANHIEGSGTANTLSGLGGADTLLGGDGADKLYGGTGNDMLAGTVVSATGDWQSGGEVHQPVFGGDLLDGGSGTDTAVFPELLQYDFKSGWSASPDMEVSLKTGRAIFTGLGVEDTLVSIENVITGGGDDTIRGSDGDNRIDAGGGANRVYGGAGNDTILFGTTSKEDVDLGPGEYLGKAYGGAGDDVLKGNGTLKDYYTGDDRPAVDYLSGGTGNDTIWQGPGSAVMSGGAGADSFGVQAHAWSKTEGGDGVVSAEVSRVKILDFDRSEGDVIHFKGAPASEDFPHVVPTFVGTADPGLNEVGYAVKGDDTVVTYAFATDGMGNDGDGNPVDHLTFELTLADYSGSLYASDFVFA